MADGTHPTITLNSEPCAVHHRISAMNFGFLLVFISVWVFLFFRSSESAATFLDILKKHLDKQNLGQIPEIVVNSKWFVLAFLAAHTFRTLLGLIFVESDDGFYNAYYRGRSGRILRAEFCIRAAVVVLLNVVFLVLPKATWGPIFLNLTIVDLWIVVYGVLAFAIWDILVIGWNVPFWDKSNSKPRRPSTPSEWATTVALVNDLMVAIFSVYYFFMLATNSPRLEGALGLALCLPIAFVGISVFEICCYLWAFRDSTWFVKQAPCACDHLVQ